MVVFKMRGSVPSARYSSICNVLRQWKTSLIPIYRVYRLYDTAYYTAACVLYCSLCIILQSVYYTAAYVLYSVLYCSLCIILQPVYYTAACVLYCSLCIIQQPVYYTAAYSVLQPMSYTAHTTILLYYSNIVV